MKELLRRHGEDGWGLYGGLKPKASVLSKLANHYDGHEPLDLWDLVRFRLVVPDLVTLQYASQYCVSELSELVRYRNYYLRPRIGWRDPYRAIHLEYADGGDYIELHVLTERRDAVGLIDHALVRKKSLCYQSSCHRDWLTSISYAANIEDAREMFRSHHTPVATTHQGRPHR